MDNLIKWISAIGALVGTIVVINQPQYQWLWIIVALGCIGFAYEQFFKKKEQSKKILFIDDDVNEFPIIETLRNNGYEIDTMPDVENLSDDKIKQSKIIFVDYKGVGQSFGKKQGLDLIKALKHKYSKKIVILFSAHRGFGIDADLNIADEVINKNAPLQDFINIIEKY